MVIEQPKEFNRYTSERVRWTKRQVLAVIKLFCPFAAFMVAFGVEFRFMDGVAIWPALVGGIAIGPAIWVVFILAIRLGKTFRRKLCLEAERICFKCGGLTRVRWEKVRTFHFEPAGPGGELHRCTIHYAIPGGAIQNWQIVLDAARKERLLAELEGRRSRGAGEYSIETGDPRPTGKIPGAPAVYVLPLWFCLAGYFFLLNSCMFLMAGLLPPEWFGCDNERNTKSNPLITEWIRQLHFHSVKEYRLFLAIIGGCLLAVSLVCFRLAHVLWKRHKRARAARTRVPGRPEGPA